MFGFEIVLHGTASWEYIPVPIIAWSPQAERNEAIPVAAPYFPASFALCFLNTENELL